MNNLKHQVGYLQAQNELRRLRSFKYCYNATIYALNGRLKFHKLFVEPFKVYSSIQNDENRFIQYLEYSGLSLSSQFDKLQYHLPLINVNYA